MKKKMHKTMVNNHFYLFYFFTIFSFFMTSVFIYRTKKEVASIQKQNSPPFCLAAFPFHSHE